MRRILLVDDHDIVLTGLESLIAVRPGWEVVGKARNEAEALGIVAQARPGYAIVDFSLGETNGIELVRRCLRLEPDLAILMFTMHESETLIAAAISAGVRGFVQKSEAGRMIEAALDAMERGEPFFPGRAGQVLLNAWMHRPVDPVQSLTPREYEIAMLIARGLSGKDIAGRLGISYKTVEVHRSAIMRKLGVRNAVELANWIARRGLTPD